MDRLAIPADHAAMLMPIQQFLAGRGSTAWLVGGYVRDLLCGRPGSDIDIAVDGSALALARELADRTDGAFVPLDDATDTARVVWKARDGSATVPFVVDLVRLRALSILDDLRLRDLTINALALPLAEALHTTDARAVLLDPTGGRSDLAQRRIRACGPTTLTDDPLRMLRAVRFAAQLACALAPETDTTLRQSIALIDTIAQERIRDELLKLFAAPHTAPWLAYLDEIRLLTRIIPELEPARDCAQPTQHFLPVLAHLFETVCVWEWLFAQINGSAKVDAMKAVPGDGIVPMEFMLPAAPQAQPQLMVSRQHGALLQERMAQDVTGGHRRYAVFKLAALLHDVGKPATKQTYPDGRITFYDHQIVGAEMVSQIGRRLRLGREATTYIQLIVREHMRPHQLHALGPELSRRAVYRLLRDTGAAAPDVLVHALCDHLAAKGPRVSLAGWEEHVLWTDGILAQRWTERSVLRTTRLITGDEVMQLTGIEPGPIVGRILAAVDEAQFLGEVRTREEALALAAQIARSEEAGTAG
jgi:poly(A) polymerase/tRNA nucleotidyltransferase (CCA-adding enzyme)